MCSAIVQRVTGQTVLDYLTPRLFAPLGISGMRWETCPRGINTGGWGLSIQTEGLAKFGQLLLQKGMWKGTQLLPVAWIEEATRFHIQQPGGDKPDRPKTNNDWLQGYGYQFWRCQNGGFRGDGAFGQYTIVLPEKDAVIVMTSENKNMQGQLDLVWKHLLPAIDAKSAAPADLVGWANSSSRRPPEPKPHPPRWAALTSWKATISASNPSPLRLTGNVVCSPPVPAPSPAALDRGIGGRLLPRHASASHFRWKAERSRAFQDRRRRRLDRRQNTGHDLALLRDTAP